MKTVAFLVNGDQQSPAAFRARAFAGLLDHEYTAWIAYRSGNKLQAIRDFIQFLGARRPAVTYVMDMGYSGVLAGFAHKLIFRNRLMIDTGDAIYALARSMGTRSRLGIWLTWLLEASSLRFANRLIVRGTMHARQLAQKGVQADVIRDGVENELFRPMNVDHLRQSHHLEGVITIGLVGSLTWNPRLQMCYGSELVEVIHLLRELPVKGVIIGNGSGLTILRARARAYGIEDRILFLGRIPYQELPRYLNLVDICLSTQTNDAVGQARTTGKLPLYLACGRYVLASRVGEAALLLSDEMLVDYQDTVDPLYPQRLAQKIRSVLRKPLPSQAASRSIAARHFEYGVLAKTLSAVLQSS